MWGVDFLLLGALAAPTAMEPPAAELPDPTRPYQYSQAVDLASIPASAEAQQWRLSGIQVRDGQKRAILNGKLVKEGDKVGEAAVAAIGTSDLTLSIDNRLVVLRLLIPSVKQDVAANQDQAPAGNK
ncbi:MAG: hypothetical protein HYY48_09250 [Gammaproteobacteria bacterium]|nr:hypothetical protein [Gammaproteobacteria bacterium]